jgi:hypothetical protein
MLIGFIELSHGMKSHRDRARIKKPTEFQRPSTSASVNIQNWNALILGCRVAHYQKMSSFARSKIAFDYHILSTTWTYGIVRRSLNKGEYYLGLPSLAHERGERSSPSATGGESEGRLLCYSNIFYLSTYKFSCQDVSQRRKEGKARPSETLE